MTAASFRVVMSWTGKRPGKRVVPVDVPTRDDAVYCALTWMVGSHARGRPVKLPRYMTFIVQERADSEWRTFREGTYKDATAEYREKDSAVPEIGAIQFVYFNGSQARRAVGGPKAPRRNSGTSRLSQFIARKLNDI